MGYTKLSVSQITALIEENPHIIVNYAVYLSFLKYITIPQSNACPVHYQSSIVKDHPHSSS